MTLVLTFESVEEISRFDHLNDGRTFRTCHSFSGNLQTEIFIVFFLICLGLDCF